MASTAKPDALSMFSGMQKKQASVSEKPRTVEVVKAATEPVPAQLMMETVSVKKTDNVVKAEIENNISDTLSVSHIPVSEPEPLKPAFSAKTDEIPVREETPLKKAPKKMGRPSHLGENKTTLSISFPDDIYEMIQVGKRAYGGNAASYIRTIIATDYEKNKDFYKGLPEIR